MDSSKNLNTRSVFDTDVQFEDYDLSHDKKDINIEDDSVVSSGYSDMNQSNENKIDESIDNEIKIKRRRVVFQDDIYKVVNKENKNALKNTVLDIEVNTQNQPKKILQRR